MFGGALVGELAEIYAQYQDAVGIIFVETLKFRQFGAAGGAFGGPEVQDYGLFAQQRRHCYLVAAD